MRVLGIDPGAERLGWAVIEAGKESPLYVGSGVLRCERGDTEEYQPYKVRMINEYVPQAVRILNEYKPETVVSEIVPVVGGGNFVAATQGHVASVAVTLFHAFAIFAGIPIEQVGATSVKKKIGGSGKATKVRVRNGVCNLLPELKPRIKEWVKEFDEPDAIGVALTWLGYTN
jgi:Holliday junction resolvasome RuvABC endonuclease subunit